jgi:hypothetical protein
MITTTTRLMWTSLVVVVYVATGITNAIDAPKPRAFHWNDDTTKYVAQREEFRNILEQKVQQFKSAYTKVEQDNRHLVVVEECIPCASMDQNHPHRHRMLAIFPSLRQRVKKVVLGGITTPPSNNTTESSDEMMAYGIDMLGNSNVSMGELFVSVDETIEENQYFLIGGIAVALAIILPLVILESMSLKSGVPILCILGFSVSIICGDCSDFVANDDTPSTTADTDFVQRYFPNGELRATSDSFDAGSDLLEILDIGLSPGTIKYLNNITVASFLNDIESNDARKPLLPIALLAIEPFLLLESISENTNTSIQCIVENCNRRLDHQQQQLSDEDQCAIDYVRCQMRNSFLIFD